ncbi:MAG: helix-turn-helix domain-containing protein [Candidatus Omnitrophica bacterium]|nr:helix-turn-helix domain-containing protein [Candidatus Omnitrophota bacterium]
MNDVIEKLRRIKEEKKYTLHELSKKLDIQVTTIERWFKKKRINRIYAQVINEKLKCL